MGLAATLAVALAVLTFGQESITVVAPANLFPQYDPPLVDMPRRVFALTGENPLDCGGFTLRETRGTFEGATRDQLQVALTCARRAIRDRRAFWTYNERRGIDSWVAHGLLWTSGGELREFSYSGSPCGGPGCEPRLSLEPCLEPYIQRAADGEPPDFRCREQ